MGCGSSSSAQPSKAVQTIKTVKEVQVASSSAAPVAETESPPPSPSKGLVYQAAVDNSSNLFAAIKRGDISATKELVSSSGGDANKLVGMWGSTPLIVALQYGQKEIAELLLREEELGDLNHVNEKGASALLYACMEGMTDIVKTLLSKQVAISERPTPEAVYNASADQSVRCTAFSIAISNGHQAIAALLIEAGADVNTKFPFPTIKSVLKPTPASFSAPTTRNNTSSATALGASDAFAMPTMRPTQSGGCDLTPILLACANGRLNVVRELLWRKCDCSVRDADGSTVLHHIARAKQDVEPMFRELKKHQQPALDVLLDAADGNGDTPLLVVCDGKQLELAKLLLEEGCSAGARNATTHSTALHVAVKRRSVELVNLLLEYGADPLVTDKANTSAYDAALKLHKDSEIHKVMLSAGSAWNKLRNPALASTAGAAGGELALPTEGTDFSVTTYYNKTPDKERARDLNTSIAPVMFNNFALTSPEKVRPDAGLLNNPVDNVKAFASPGLAESDLLRPLVTLDPDEQAQLSAAAAQVLKHVAGPSAAATAADAADGSTVAQSEFEKPHRVSLVVEGFGSSEGTDTAVSNVPETPVRIPHHTPSAKEPKESATVPAVGTSGKVPSFRASFLSSPNADASKTVGTASALNSATIPVLTGSAAVAAASGVYRQSSFKASNLGIIAPTKILSKDVASGKLGSSSPAVRASEEIIAAALGATDSGAAGAVATSSGSGSTDRPAPLLARKSFKGTELPTDGSFKSPYMFATPAKPKKAPSGADSIDTLNTAAKVEKDHDGAPAEESRGAENTSFDMSGNFGSPVPNMSSTGGAPSAANTTSLLAASLTTPARKSMRGTGAMGNSTTLPGASTTMKSTLTAATTPTQQTSGAMESKSAFAPRRPSNAPSSTDAARSAVRSSRFRVSQKNKADATSTGAATPLAQTISNSGVQTPVIGANEDAEVVGEGNNSNFTKVVSAAEPPPAKDAGSAFKRASFVRKTSTSTPSK